MPSLRAGKNAPGLVNTAFTVLIPTPANIQAFLEAQTGGNLNYLITTLLGSPASAPPLPRCMPCMHAHLPSTAAVWHDHTWLLHAMHSAHACGHAKEL
jgi:hypothetical protein